MLRWTFATLGLLVVTGFATAQGTGLGGSTGRPAATLGSPLAGGIGSAPVGPTVSPYLNLFRGGSGAAVNYYGLVRPQMSTQSSLQSLQQQVYSAGGQQDDTAGTGVISGTRVRFMSYGGYFLNMNGGTSTGSAVGGGSGTGSLGGATGGRSGLAPLGSLSGGFSQQNSGNLGGASGGRGGSRPGPRN